MKPLLAKSTMCSSGRLYRCVVIGQPLLACFFLNVTPLTITWVEKPASLGHGDNTPNAIQPDFTSLFVYALENFKTTIKAYHGVQKW